MTNLESPSQPVPQNAEEALHRAIAHHQAGRVQEAERLYRDILQAQPNHPDANHNLGVLAVQVGQPMAALPHFRAALEANQHQTQYWLSYIGALIQAGQTSVARQALAQGRQRGLAGDAVDALVKRLESDVRVSAQSTAPTPQEIETLSTLFGEGRYAEIEPLARAMTVRSPEHGFGWKALGAALNAMGRSADALAANQKAAALLPDDAEAHSNLGATLKNHGKLQEAEASYRRALEINPEFAAAHNNLGLTLKDQGQSIQAEVHLRRALRINPDFAEAHGNLGGALQEQGRLVEAEVCCHRALQINANYAVGHNNLGNTLRSQGRLAEAEKSYLRALEIKPDYAEAHGNLGVNLKEQGRVVEAEACYRRALEINPEFAAAHNNLGLTLKDQGQSIQAEVHLRRALQINPDFAEAHGNLGGALQEQGRLVEAEVCCRRALQINANYAVGHNNLGNTLRSQGRLAEAEKSYLQALEIKPDYADAHSNLIFVLDLIENCSLEQQQAERRRWYEQHGVRYAQGIQPHENSPDPERRLRIGYVSADFRRHSAYYAFSPILLRHDHNAFEVVCYSGVMVEDDATARLKQAVHEWRSTVGVSDDALAEQIRRDRIDILVDLSGHSRGNQLLVFARKPAPVQVSAWGHATGTGMETMDYFLSDPVLVPQEEKSLYAEQVIDLPCAICYESPDYLPEVSPLPALGGRPLTFGCINRIEKITDRVMALWGRILAELPEAQLLLKDGTCDDPMVRQQLLQRLDAAGIAAERVRILGYSRHADHLKTYQEIDLGLDPFPQNGGISTAEALSMGVPVVSLYGATIPSRIASSILTVLEMPEWVAHSEEEYIRIAVHAARDLPGLARTRSELRARLLASPFGDVHRYTREVEAAFRAMWKKWCNVKLHTAT